jgi:hypothetical protein
MSRLTYIKNDDGHFVCPHCGEVKEKQNTMHYHMKKHEGEMPFKCKTCKKGFLQKQTLDLHIQAKHPELIESENKKKKEYCCPFEDCAFTALSKGNRRIHCMRTHYKKQLSDYIEKSGSTYTCLICSEEYDNSTHFYYHIGECAKEYNIIKDDEVFIKCL